METRAIVINQYGGKEVLTEAQVTLPALGATQVLVAVKAASVNPLDWKVREGYTKGMMNWAFPIILGWDVAGVIKEVGSQVSQWQVGDRVFARPATTPFGTYADDTIVDQELLAKIPENIDFATAAAVPLAGLTAYQALFDHGHLKAGEKVLIHAGAGGVGQFAIQLAKQAGATVYTTASRKNHQLLKSLGADVVIDYREQDFTEVVHDIDLVVDTMGGATQLASIQVLKEGGRLISILAIEDPAALSAKKIHGEAIWLQPNGRQLKELAAMLAAGKLRSVIAGKFPLTVEGVAEAHELSESHHAVGKIVLENLG